MELRWRIGAAVIVSLVVFAIAISGLLRQLPNACVMTYMYPTYVPVPAAPSSNSGKYGLFLYHEGWKSIDFSQHLRDLSGVPVLFIPGNGGSYKQVRSLAAESDRAYHSGPWDETYYRESTFTDEEAGLSSDHGWTGESWMPHLRVRDLMVDAGIQGEYMNHLDWFAVDLEGEHSALDGRILEEHTHYVVQAIHRILDQYKASLLARSGSSKVSLDGLPKSVILVGHSMGGFVARAAVVDPELREGAVETVVTLSTPHLLAPVALQPSLGQFFSRVNRLWREGYEAPRTRSGRVREPPLARVVVVSVPGGVHDYQVRSRMASLDGIVPATNALTVGAPGMLNAWLSTEHQTILWCNQLVVQVSHTLLKLIDSDTGQAYSSPQKRLGVFIEKFRSALTQRFDWLSTANISDSLHGLNAEEISTLNQLERQKDECPIVDQRESHEKDFFVEGESVTVLAMDGRRRWLDIKKQVLNGRNSFALVTNLSPCLGIRIHLWREKGKTLEDMKEKAIEVTRRMVQLPAGPAPRQIEPGGQTEQAPPTGVLKLTSRDMEGYRYITISIAPRPTVFGRPPPATSMAVGQFFSSNEARTGLSPWWLLSSFFGRQSLELAEKHPLAMNFSLSISLGVLPLTMEVRTASCGISENQETSKADVSALCALRCFPPLALVWDPYSGLEVLPNLQSATVVSDSSPLLGGSRYAYHQSALMLLVDPHCGYKVTVQVARVAAVSSFFLSHWLQIGGFIVAAVLFALMKQARAWELDLPIPSVFSCLEQNLAFPLPFALLCIGPLFLHFTFATFESPVPPPYVLTAVVAVICYVLANGIVALLATSTMVMFHATASLEVLIRARWQLWSNTRFKKWFLTRATSYINLQMVRSVLSRPKLTTGILATLLVFFVHPALGLGVLLLSHTWSCHAALRCYRHQRGKQTTPRKIDDKQYRNGNAGVLDDATNRGLPQLEAFKFWQGLLLLHLTATCMLLPSLVAWVQNPKVDHTLPWCIDSALSFGIILHGLCADMLDSPFRKYGWSLVYGVAGAYTYWTGLVLAPYKAFYALCVIGIVAAALRFAMSQSVSSKYQRRHHNGKARRLLGDEMA